MSETEATSKVEELMKALDEVKRYRALSRLTIDFTIITLATVVTLLSIEIFVNTLRVTTGFPCSYQGAATFSCGDIVGVPVSPVIVILAGLSLLLVPIVGILGGVLWVDRRLKSVKVGEWKDTLKEGFPGAVKLLTQMKWESVFEEIEVSKLGYMIYGAVKVFGYFLLVSLLLFFPYTLVTSFIHTDINLYTGYLVSIVLVLVLSRNDLQRRYRQIWSLNALMWELRWFSSEFRSADFKT